MFTFRSAQMPITDTGYYYTVFNLPVSLYTEGVLTEEVTAHTCSHEEVHMKKSVIHFLVYTL